MLLLYKKKRCVVKQLEYCGRLSSIHCLPVCCTKSCYILTHCIYDYSPRKQELFYSQPYIKLYIHKYYVHTHRHTTSTSLHGNLVFSPSLMAPSHYLYQCLFTINQYSVVAVTWASIHLVVRHLTRHLTTKSRNGLLPESTKPWLGPALTYSPITASHYSNQC